MLLQAGALVHRMVQPPDCQHLSHVLLLELQALHRQLVVHNLPRLSISRKSYTRGGKLNGLCGVGCASNAEWYRMRETPYDIRLTSDL